MKRIRVGQIGVCHEHAEGKMTALRNMPEVYEIVGVVDDKPTTAARFAGDDLQPYEGLTWLSEEELFSTPGLQAVLVETPNTELVPTAMRCMNQNLAMHMDKPAGEDLPAFARLLTGCEERALPLQLGYMFRNNPAMQLCLKAARGNWLGEVFEIQANMSHNYGGDAYQQYLAHFKGGIMFNLGCHLIDLVVAMLGRPETITTFLDTAPGSSCSTKDNCLAVLQYLHTTVMLNACSLEVEGMAHRRLKVCGTKGTIELSPLERFDGQPLEMRLSLLEGNEEYDSGTHIVDLGVRDDRYVDQLLELARIIRGEMENPYTYAHDSLVQEVVLAASGYTAWNGGNHGF